MVLVCGHSSHASLLSRLWATLGGPTRQEMELLQRSAKSIAAADPLSARVADRQILGGVAGRQLEARLRAQRLALGSAISGEYLYYY